MFHRVDEPLELPSSRFFRIAERLPLRGGAVTDALAAAGPRADRSEGVTSTGAADPPVHVGHVGPAAGDNSAEIAALAAMSQNPGFPGIGYSGG